MNEFKFPWAHESTAAPQPTQAPAPFAPVPAMLMPTPGVPLPKPTWDQVQQHAQMDAQAQFEAATAHLTQKDVEKLTARMAIMCVYCGDLIHFADSCIEIFCGKLGHMPKSGRLGVVPLDDPADFEIDVVLTLHPQCIAGWATDTLDVDEHLYTEQYCIRCEELIEND